MAIKSHPPTPTPITFKDGPAPSNPDPNTVYLPKYHRELRDQALGIYMDTWSRTEGAMRQVFGELTGDPEGAGRAIFAILTAQQIRDAMTALSRTALDATDQKTLEALLERAKRAATKRNRIVHGRWNLEIDQQQETGIVFSAEWSRLYEPSDPETLAEVQNPKGDAKIRNSHRFTVSHVHQASADVETLMTDFMNFHAALYAKRSAAPSGPTGAGGSP